MFTQQPIPQASCSKLVSYSGDCGRSFLTSNMQILPVMMRVCPTWDVYNKKGRKEALADASLRPFPYYTPIIFVCKPYPKNLYKGRAHCAATGAGASALLCSRIFVHATYFVARQSSSVAVFKSLSGGKDGAIRMLALPVSEQRLPSRTSGQPPSRSRPSYQRK